MQPLKEATMVQDDHISGRGATVSPREMTIENFFEILDLR